MSVSIAFMGTPEFAVAPLQTLLEHGYTVKAVYTRPDHPSGRGLKLTYSPVKELAIKENLRLMQPGSLRSASEIERLKEINPELVVVAAYGQILPLEVLSIPRYGCLNIHPSLLPRHRGPSPVASTLLAGDEKSGVSLMLLDEGTDTGPLVSQRETTVEEGDNTGTLTSRLSQLGAELLVEIIPAWISGKIRAVPQDDERATTTARLGPGALSLDFSQDALTLYRQIRAFSPEPGAFTLYKGRRLIVESACPVSGSAVGLPGTVQALTGNQKTPLAVVTGNGLLGLICLKLEGKRSLGAAEFMRGQRDFMGGRLPS